VGHELGVGVGVGVLVGVGEVRGTHIHEIAGGFPRG